MKLFSAGLFWLVGCGAMNADVIFTLGNHPSGDVNILLNSGATGTTVTGQPNQLPGVTVDFTSTQTLLEPSSGQARVSANPEGNPLTNLSISLEGGLTYGDLIINPFQGGPGVCALCMGGPSTITVNAVTSTGVAEAPFVFTGLNIGNGNNFLTITTSGGEAIVSTSISVLGGINDLRQPRISGPFNPISQVPEPSNCWLLGCLLGLGLLSKELRKA
jgi:hypothetical protein